MKIQVMHLLIYAIRNLGLYNVLINTHTLAEELYEKANMDVAP